MGFQRKVEILVVIVFIGSFLLSDSFARTASPADFSSATNAIGAAFEATYDAGQSGGNVSQLVAKLNLALSFVQEARATNATNPALATTLLQNATQIAQQVSAQAPVVASNGANVRSMRIDESAGASVVIIFVAAMVYLFGDRIYRRLWLMVYKDFVVRPTNV